MDDPLYAGADRVTAANAAQLSWSGLSRPSIHPLAPVLAVRRLGRASAMTQHGAGPDVGCWVGASLDPTYTFSWPVFLPPQGGGVFVARSESSKQ